MDSVTADGARRFLPLAIAAGAFPQLQLRLLTRHLLILLLCLLLLRPSVGELVWWGSVPGRLGSGAVAARNDGWEEALAGQQCVARLSQGDNEVICTVHYGILAPSVGVCHNSLLHILSSLKSNLL